MSRVRELLEPILLNSQLDPETKRSLIADALATLQELGKEDFLDLESLLQIVLLHNEYDIVTLFVEHGVIAQNALDHILRSPLPAEEKLKAVTKILSLENSLHLDPSTLADCAFVAILEGNYACAIKLIDHQITTKATVYETVVETAARNGIPEQKLVTNLEQHGFVTIAKMKEENRRTKAVIMAHGPLTPLGKDPFPHHTPNVIMSLLYLGSDKGVLALPSIEALYQSDCMKPLMYMMAMTGLGVSLPPKKRFKVVGDALVTPHTLAPKLAGGLYTGKHTAFVQVGLTGCNTLIRVIHESAHFAIHRLYNNTSNPYPEDNEGLQQHYLDAIEATLDRLEGKEPEYEICPEQGTLQLKSYDSLYRIIMVYPMHNQAAEFIVRIPEIIATLGSVAGPIWLEHTVPELFFFYSNIINRDIQEYCARYGIDKYLRVEDLSSIPLPPDSLPEEQACIALARAGHVEALKATLAAHRGNPVLIGKCLIAAGNSGQLEAVKLALTETPDGLFTPEFLEHVLICFCACGHTPVIQLFLSVKGEMISAQSKDKALLIAARTGHTKAVKAILDHCRHEIPLPILEQAEEHSAFVGKEKNRILFAQLREKAKVEEVSAKFTSARLTTPGIGMTIGKETTVVS